MLETSEIRRLIFALALLLVGMVLALSEAVGEERGQYGGNLEFLARHHTAPSAGENNYYIDLWTPGALPALARVNGLTNNHALFVDSHGKGGCSPGNGYGFFPKQSLVPAGTRTPYYSVRDLAAILGAEAVQSIHNIVLAGCNEEGRFDSREVRRYFPNATNITHMAAGQLAYKPMYYQAIVHRVEDIRPLYGLNTRTRDGRIETQIVNEPMPGAKPLGNYLADLYLPGGRAPYRTRPAGRELLEPVVSGREVTLVMNRSTTVSSQSAATTGTEEPKRSSIVITRQSIAAEKLEREMSFAFWQLMAMVVSGPALR